MQKDLEVKLDLGGIQLLGKERPDILVVICKDNFLPPTQLIFALQALEWYPDKEGLKEHLEELLNHDSKSIREQTRKTLKVEYGDETA